MDEDMMGRRQEKSNGLDYAGAREGDKQYLHKF